MFPLPLDGVVCRTFAGERPYDQYMLGLLDDLAGLYDLEYDRKAFAARRRTTFTTMVAELLPELTGDGAPVGLVVLAHSTPDGEPNWPACFLNRHLPGHPFAFAVADQGPVAPFTALRIAAAYIRAGDRRRAIVIALDQDTVLGAPGRAAAPAGNRAVALIFDHRGVLGELSLDVSAHSSGGVETSATAPWALLAERIDAGAEEVRIGAHDPVSGAHGSAVLRAGARHAV